MKRELSPHERRDWLRLSLSENVGPITFRTLIARCGSAAKAIAALPVLSRQGGLRQPLRLYGEAEAEADLARAEALGAAAVTLGEEGYPDFLRHIDTCPPVLWIKGDRQLVDRPAIAMVGSRNASALGLKFTRMLAAELGAAGYVIVSGLARGIDAAAHQVALATGTVAALAGGLDSIYPPENEALHAMIGEQGLLVSEMKPGTVPRAEHFPRRNRIISGMARATIVVEAALRSGSLITARLAAEQGREVFAVPGSPLDPRAEGTNRLIRQGATLVTSAADVLEALTSGFSPATQQFLEPAAEPPRPIEPDDGERRRLLSPSPVDSDDLARESGLHPAVLAGLLLELELAGRLLRHPLGKVSLT
ncbi:MAG: DNA-protecting protein DprA [Rhizobiales bacterium]|nr:DNA-protecting protein DprA [Hyphomicrobiales bacterium]